MPELPDVNEIRSVLKSGIWDLSNRRLTALPPEISQLTRLQTLRLDGNQLTVLPPEIGQLTGLRYLELDRNQLTELPPESASLRTLYSSRT
jgi:internalin A